MTRKAALAAIYAAGTRCDQRALMQIYPEHRISYSVAMAKYAEGVRWALWVAARDSAAAHPSGDPGEYITV